MSVEFIDLLDLPELEIGCSKKVLFTSDHFHTWVHGDYPGTKGPMHKHTADQQFLLREGRVYFSFSRRPVAQTDSRRAGDDSRRSIVSAR